MGAVSWLVSRRAIIYMLSVLVSAAGINILFTHRKELFPPVVFPQFHIIAAYPGASPSEIEESILEPLERELSTLRDIDKIEAFAYEGMGVLVVRFETSVDRNIARQDVESAVNRAKLPTDLPSDPQVVSINFAETPMVYVYIAGQQPLSSLRDIARNLKEEIEELPDVARVEMSGVGNRRFLVEVDMVEMAAAGLSFRDIATLIERENRSLQAGELKAGTTALPTTIKSSIKKPQDIEAMVVRSNAGAVIPLGDIVEVKDTLEDRKGSVRINGQRAIALTVIKKSSGNIVRGVESVKKIIEKWKQNLPPGVNIYLVNDMSHRIKVTLSDLYNSIVLGFVLVSVVLMFFLGVRQALVVGIAVPLSAFVALAFLPVYDYTLNMMVLFALLFTLGIVVDDAIVVVENIHRLHAEEKIPIWKAVPQAVSEVFLPVLSGTLTTLAPFVPLSFFPGVIGEFIRSFPIMVATSMMASLAVAYLFNTVASVDMLQTSGTTQWGISNLFNRWVWNPFVRVYRRTLELILTPTRSAIVVVGMLILLVLSVILFVAKPPRIVFIPADNPAAVFVRLEFKEGTAFEHIQHVATIYERKITALTQPYSSIIEAIITQTGIDAPATSSILAHSPGSYNRATISIYFVPVEERPNINTDTIVRLLSRSLSDTLGAHVVVEAQRRGPPAGKPVEIELRGDNLDSLNRIAHRIAEALRTSHIQGLTSIEVDDAPYRSSLQVVMDRRHLTHQGLNASQVADFLRTALAGKKVTSVTLNGEEVDIWLQAKPSQAKTPSLLLQTPIVFMDMSMRGQLRYVPVGSVATIEHKTDFAQIHRKNGQRIVKITAEVLPGYSEQTVVREVKKFLDKLSLPEGITYSMGGEQELQQEATSFLQKAFIISAFLLIAILYLQFASVWRTLLIASEILLSAGGVLLGYFLTQKTFSVLLSGIGIVGLAGIVMKNGILVVEFIDRWRERGVHLRDAIIRGALLRARPVLLTALTTILGLLPLAVGFAIDLEKLVKEGALHYSLGSENTIFWGPLSWTIVFGLAFSTILTLVVVPAVYYLITSSKRQPNTRP